MSGERQRWSGREWPIIRKKKPMEVEHAIFKQDISTGLTPLRFVKAAPPRRKKKTAEDLERGWSNDSSKADISKQPTALPCFAFRDNAMKGDFARNEFEKSKKCGKVEGWITNFAEQKKKELDEVYGKESSRIKSNDKRVETAWAGNSKEEHRGKMGNRRVIIAELRKKTERSRKSTSRPPRSPHERCERFLDALCFRSPKGIEAELLSMDSSHGDTTDTYVCFRQEHEKCPNADMGWKGRTREASGFRIPGARTAVELSRETEDEAQEDSWFNAYQHVQKRELFGLRSYSIGDDRSKWFNGEDLSWAANCRAKLKAQITAAAPRSCER